MKKVVILTGTELRHTFMRKYLALNPQIEVLKTYTEQHPPLVSQDNKEETARLHMAARETSEEDFFGSYRDLPDYSNPTIIKPKEINEPNIQNEIQSLKPDLILAYGCSIIKGDLLKKFEGKFLNLHLGLSPYYRGTGTNFWPLVNNEPEFIGATFMHIDAGIDTGPIIHQLRARIFANDTAHQIGNRLISDSIRTYAKLVINFETAKKSSVKTADLKTTKIYRKSDFKQSAVDQMYKNFQSGMIEKFLKEKSARYQSNPIISNLAIQPPEGL